MNQTVSRRDLVRIITRHLLDDPTQRGQWLRRLAAYIITHGLDDQTDLIINDIAHELHRQAGIVTAEVVSARQLSAEVRDSIERMLQAETGAKSVVMHESIDVELLGGFVARTADAEIDASVRSRLKALAALA